MMAKAFYKSMRTIQVSRPELKPVDILSEKFERKIMVLAKTRHCMKSVRIRSYSGPHFPAFGLNAERYGVSLCIQFECGKIRTRTTPNTDSFYAVRLLSIENVILFRQSIVCSCITFSIILETVGRSEIGLKFSWAVLVPFLYRGLSFANLQSIVK